MNPESKLTDAQRAMLGAEAADELVRDEQWFAERLRVADPRSLSAGVPARLMRGLVAELEAHRISLPGGDLSGAGDGPAHGATRRRRAWLAAAAMVLFALLVGLLAKFMLPAQPVNQAIPVAGTAAPAHVAAAQQAVAAYVGAVDSYLRAVDRDEVQAQAQAEIGRMDRMEVEMSRPADFNVPDGAANPWDAVASAIANPNP